MKGSDNTEKMYRTNSIHIYIVIIALKENLGYLCSTWNISRCVVQVDNKACRKHQCTSQKRINNTFTERMNNNLTNPNYITVNKNFMKILLFNAWEEMNNNITQNKDIGRKKTVIGERNNFNELVSTKSLTFNSQVICQRMKETNIFVERTSQKVPKSFKVMICNEKWDFSRNASRWLNSHEKNMDQKQKKIYTIEFEIFTKKYGSYKMAKHQEGISSWILIQNVNETTS